MIAGQAQSGAKPSLTHVLMALAAATACSGGSVLAAEPLGTRVVRAGYANVQALKANIETSVSFCQTKLGLPLVPVEPPSDSYLQALEIFRIQEDFLGPLNARYEVQSSVAADLQGGCKLSLFQHRRVEIQRSCDWRLFGQTPLLGQLLDGDSNVPATSQLDRERMPADMAAQCAVTQQAVTVKDLPQDSAGLGQACVWWDAAITAQSLRSAGLAGPAPSNQPKAGDFCVYARKPVHRYSSQSGQSMMIVLKTFDSNQNMAGSDISEIVGEARATNMRLIDFADEVAIPKSQFESATAKAFLSLPVKQALGAKK